MATRHSNALARLAISPSIAVLLLWMIVPLAITIWFSFLRYNLLDPGSETFTGLNNYYYFLTDPSFFKALKNTLLLVGAVLLASVVLGILFALLLDQTFYGQTIVRLMIIAPFFIMPTVSALVWKNMLMHPVSGFFAYLSQITGFQPIDWFVHAPLTAICIMVSWQWVPFAKLIFLTSIQSLDEEQKEAAQMDGTPPFSYFYYIVLPHLARPIAVVLLIETIFLLNFDVGGASAGGIIAVILANFVAVFLVRMVGKNLEN